MMKEKNLKEGLRGSSFKKLFCLLLSFVLLLTALSACSAKPAEEGVAETENIKIELVENKCILNTLVLKFKVTAKKLDSLSIDEVPLAEHLGHCMFGIDVFEDMKFGNATEKLRYIYSDEDPSLSSNQFYYCRFTVNDDRILGGDYYFRFSDFGFYPKEKNGGMEVLYDDVLEVPVKITNDADSGRYSEPNIKYNIGGEEFLLSRAMITPYAIVLKLSGESDNAGINNLSLQDVSVNLKDGKTMSPTVNIDGKKNFEASLLGDGPIGSIWKGSYVLRFYEETIDVDSIAGITVGGSFIDLGAK